MSKTPLFTLLVFALFLYRCSEKPKDYIFMEGFTQGGSFHIKYQPNPDSVSSKEIYQLLNNISASLSIYDSNSILSRINRNDTTVEPDRYFTEVYRASYKIYQMTDGAFDITVAPLVRYWGFLPKDSIVKESQSADSLLKLIGMDKTHLNGNKITKDNPLMEFDVNAIAQGYTVDKVAMLLESKNIKNYMVEVGGELKVKGRNPDGLAWKVGVDKPIENSDEFNRELENILLLKDVAVATSGSYRKYVEINGIKYAHTINPKTGLPTHHNLLSVTILAVDATTADALATAVMVMGLENGKQFIQENNLSAYLIYSDEKGKLKTWFTKNLEKEIKPIEANE